MKRPDEVETLIDHLERFIRAVIFNHETNELAAAKLLNAARTTLEEYIVELAGIKPKEELNELKCPECDSGMILRSNKQSGQKFWGCSKYPNCRGTRDENGLSREEREEAKYKKEQVAQEGGFSFNRDKRNPVTEVNPPVETNWINPFAKR